MNENYNLPPENGEIFGSTRTPPRPFSVLECIFAWLCFAAGYAFWRIFPIGSNPLGGFIFVVVLFAATAVILLRKGVKLKLLPLLAAASAITVSLGLFFSANGTLHFFSYAYALAVYCYFLYAAGGNIAGFSDWILIDFIKALFVLPFHSFGQLFRAMFSGKASGGGKFLFKLLLGIAAAFIPTVTVLTLLSYDSGFSALIGKIFSFDLSNIFSHILSLALAIPVGMYLFGLYVSSIDRKCMNIMSAERCKAASSQVRFVPVVTALAAVVPLLCVYLIFFISQWQYYISGFTGSLPASFSYAEYAREGFFQLCAVSVINFFVVMAIMLFLRRDANRPPVLLKVLTVLFSVLTLILISTAAAKMVMYINCYGLTQKRVYATWLMAVLAVVFLLILLRQFIPRLNAVALSLTVCVVLFAVLSLANTDALIARYNVDRYLDGSLATVDVEAIDALGDAGIPDLVRLAGILEDRIDKGSATEEERALYDDLLIRIHRKAEMFAAQERGIFSFTLPYIRARDALRSFTDR